MKDIKQFIFNCTKSLSVREKTAKQCYPVQLNSESLLWLKQYRLELVITQTMLYTLSWNVTCILRTIHVPPHSFTACFPNHLRKWLQEKNKPLMVVVAQSFPIVAIIAFPVQIAQFVERPDKGSSIHLEMGKPIFAWLIVGILFSTGCTPLAEMTNFHLHCERIWGEGDLYRVFLSHHTEYQTGLRNISNIFLRLIFLLCVNFRQIYIYNLCIKDYHWLYIKMENPLWCQPKEVVLKLSVGSSGCHHLGSAQLIQKWVEYKQS